MRQKLWRWLKRKRSPTNTPFHRLAFGHVQNTCVPSSFRLPSLFFFSCFRFLLSFFPNSFWFWICLHHSWNFKILFLQLRCFLGFGLLNLFTFLNIVISFSWFYACLFGMDLRKPSAWHLILWKAMKPWIVNNMPDRPSPICVFHKRFVYLKLLEEMRQIRWHSSIVRHSRSQPDNTWQLLCNVGRMSRWVQRWSKMWPLPTKCPAFFPYHVFSCFFLFRSQI